MSKTAILILAAGKSSRMKTAKQLLPFNGITLLGHAIQTAQKTNAHQVLVVVGAHKNLVEKEVDKYAVKPCYNPLYEQGMGTSIAKGIEVLKTYDGVLIMLADQPLINTQYLDDMICKGVETGKIVASLYKYKNGVPAYFPKRYFKQLAQLNEDKGARHLLNNKHTDILHINTAVNLMDIDIVSDFERLECLSK